MTKELKNMTLLSPSSFLYSGRMEKHSKTAWRKISLFSAKERESLQQNEALTSSPVLGNCSTVYQSRRSAFFPTNSFDFLRSSWNSNRFSRCDSRKGQSPGRGIKTQKQPAFTCRRPLSNGQFFTIWELNMEPWVGSGNSWKSVQDGWWKPSRGGGGSMQILKTGNWRWALGFAERNHSRPSAKPITGSCKACANSVGARWQMRKIGQQIRMVKRLWGFKAFCNSFYSLNNNVEIE